jgi:hypothetical protein
MRNTFNFRRLEAIIVQNPRFLFTFTSYVLVIAMDINLIFLKSFSIGVLSFILYFSINGTFLAHALFAKETAFFRLTFGALLLIMLLGFVGWLIMLIYDLDLAGFTIVLLITTTLSSLLNSRIGCNNVT